MVDVGKNEKLRCNQGHMMSELLQWAYVDLHEANKAADVEPLYAAVIILRMRLTFG